MSLPENELRVPLTALSFQLLLALADEARHGYGIVKEIEQATDGAMKPATGAVYLAIQRMVDEGLICNEAPPTHAAVDERTALWHSDSLRRRALEFVNQVAVIGAVHGDSKYGRLLKTRNIDQAAKAGGNRAQVHARR